jgi:hypothetical protein
MALLVGRARDRLLIRALFLTRLWPMAAGGVVKVPAVPAWVRILARPWPVLMAGEVTAMSAGSAPRV